MTDFYIKQNDLVPVIEVTLKDGEGDAVDLSAATAIEFHMWTLRAHTVKVNTAAAFIDKPLGLVKYVWVGADTDTPGPYCGEFQVTWPSGKETFPNDSNIEIMIRPEIA